MAIRKAYVDLADGQMHYRYSVSPKGGTPLVFLHQTASSSAMYQAVMEKLDGAFTMYALDTPGFGSSFRPPRKPDVAYYVNAVVEAMKALGISQCHLFGHHTGAAIACQLAADFPGHVEKLGMIGPVQLTQADRDLWQKTAIHPMLYAASGEHLQWTWQRVTNLDSQPIQYPPSPALATREAIDTLIAGDRWHEAYEAVFGQDFPACLARVKAPILMVCGDGDVLYPYFEAAKKARPDAKAVELKAGAYVLDQDPSKMAEILREFFGA